MQFQTFHLHLFSLLYYEFYLYLFVIPDHKIFLYFKFKDVNIDLFINL